jgi:hypothetical protein
MSQEQNSPTSLPDNGSGTQPAEANQDHWKNNEKGRISGPFYQIW